MLNSEVPGPFRFSSENRSHRERKIHFVDLSVRAWYYDRDIYSAINILKAGTPTLSKRTREPGSLSQATLVGTGGSTRYRGNLRGSTSVLKVSPYFSEGVYQSNQIFPRFSPFHAHTSQQRVRVDPDKILRRGCRQSLP